MTGRCARAAAAALIVLAPLAATITAAAHPEAAAGGDAWWRPGPRLAAIAIATTAAPSTLVATRSATFWVDPEADRVAPTGLPAPATAVAVTASGAGVAALTDGTVRLVAGGQGGATLATLASPVRALAAAGPATHPLVLAATGSGLWLLRAHRLALRLVRGAATAVVAPTAPGLPWWALVAGRLYGSRDGIGWAEAFQIPPLPPATRVLAELGDGTLIAAEPNGLVVASAGRGLAPDLQVLPAGGFAGVPAPTGLAAVGPTSAYLATRGFAALLTPDDGYDWYRAAPSELPATLGAIASVGPVTAPARPHGDVVAAGPGRLFLHRLQTLPGPPVYTGGTAWLELAGIAATTVAAILIGLTGLAVLGRRHGRRRLGRPV